MNVNTQKPQLDNSSLNLFLGFFHERINATISLGSKTMSLSKQMQIRKLRTDIERFIKEHEYSYITMALLSAREDYDLDRPESGIIVKNFQLFREGDAYKTPRRYFIGIMPSWTEARYFQLSPSGLRIEETLS
jgi:hypothetical protein